MSQDPHTTDSQSSTGIVRFDDRVWPVHLAIGLLGAASIALFVAPCHFDDPRMLYNGWSRLALVTTGIAMLFWTATALDRRMPNRWKLALTLSVLCHLLLTAAITDQSILGAGQPTQPAAERVVDATRDLLHEYPVQPIDREKEPFDFERPHRIDVPAVQTDVLNREQRSEKATSSMQQTGRLPETPRPIHVSAVELRRAELAIPRLADATSKLSKRIVSPQSAQPDPIAEPRDAEPLPRVAPRELQPTETLARPQPQDRTIRVAQIPLPAPTPAAVPTTVDPAETMRQKPMLVKATQPARHLDQSPGGIGPAGSADEFVATPAASKPSTAPASVARLRPAVTSQPRSLPSESSRDRPAPDDATHTLPTVAPAGRADPAVPVAAPTIASQPRPSRRARKAEAATLADANQTATGPDAVPGVQADRSGPPVEAATGRVARSSGTIPVHVRAEVAAGGLGSELSAETGLVDNRASPISPLIQQDTGRYLQKKTGGPASIDGRVRDATDAFTHRGRRQQELQSGGRGEPLAPTEAAIESGLRFLARTQSTDGRWSLHQFAAGRPAMPQETAAIQADTAGTGLALLAFLGAGYDHFDGQFQNAVQTGLDFLVKNQSADGRLFLDHNAESNRVAQLYSHSIATIALCEAVGMTGDRVLGEAAQKAIDFIVASQHPQLGGWRYTPGLMSDLSVTGWQMMALKSGELAGLDVPPETYQKAVAFLDRCRGSGQNSALYAYNPFAPQTRRQQHGRQPSTVMTAVGLLMQLYSGHDRTDPDVQRGADHLLKNLPDVRFPASSGTLGNPMRDTYYWYYASQVMFHMKGHYWQAWSGALDKAIVGTQVTSGPYAGSWDPRRPVPDRWGAHGGRIYVTAMNLLSLQVAYRHLPLYEHTAR